MVYTGIAIDRCPIVCLSAW